MLFVFSILFIYIIVINLLIPWWILGRFSILNLDIFELDRLNRYLNIGNIGTIYNRESPFIGLSIHRVTGILKFSCPFIRYYSNISGRSSGVVFSGSKLSRTLDSKFRHLEQIQIDSDAIERKLSNLSIFLLNI